MTNIMPPTLNVKEYGWGAWLVYEAGQEPIDGSAVHEYGWGWRCECGVILNGRSTMPACVHIRAVWKRENARAFPPMPTARAFPPMPTEEEREP